MTSWRSHTARSQAARLEAELRHEKDQNFAFVARHTFRPGVRNFIACVGYTVALRRNLAHVVAGIAAKVVLGTESADKNVIIKLEHRAAHAKRVRSREQLSRERLATDLTLQGSDVVVDVTCYKDGIGRGFNQTYTR